MSYLDRIEFQLHFQLTLAPDFKLEDAIGSEPNCQIISQLLDGPTTSRELERLVEDDLHQSQVTDFLRCLASSLLIVPSGGYGIGGGSYHSESIKLTDKGETVFHHWFQKLRE